MTVLISVLLFCAGAGLAWVVLWAKRAALAERLRAAEENLAKASAELAAERTSKESLGAAAARLGAEVAAERAGHDRLKAEFAELSASALRTNSDDFLKVAKQAFEQQQEKSASDLTMRQQAIDALVKPLRDSLEKVDLKINELEQKRASAYGALGAQLESLSAAQLRMQAETSKLSTALSTTKTAGTWGEVQLRRVVEWSGMMEHCDFEVQKVDDAGRGRPDLVVNLPGGQRIVVDAKAPTAAFREAAALTDENAKAAKLMEHASVVRGHIEALSKREYWASFQPAPEFVVLFLPGDAFLSAAIESDPAILDRAMERNVLLATPITLVALLKAAAYGWRLEAVSKSAEEVSKQGRELYDRIATFADHLGDAARGLNGATASFNKALSSFEQRIIPSARKLSELGAKGTKELSEPAAIETMAREPSKRS